jgi:hypothetical protein
MEAACGARLVASTHVNAYTSFLSSSHPQLELTEEIDWQNNEVLSLLHGILFFEDHRLKSESADNESKQPSFSSIASIPGN